MRHYVSLPDDSAIHIRVSGSGPAVLMLRDWPLSGAVSGDLAAALSTGATVVAPDSPGYGQSSTAPLPDDLDGHARVLVSLMETLGIERFAVVGTGLGAVLGVAVAAAASDRVAAVLVDQLPSDEALARLDPDLLVPTRDPQHSGAHVLEAWIQLRDASIFEPWYDRRAVARLTGSVPDPRTIHRRLVDVLTAPGPWDSGVRSALRYGVDAARAALPVDVVRTAPGGWPAMDPGFAQTLELLPAVDRHRLDLALAPAPHRGGRTRRYLTTSAGRVHVRLDGDPSAQPVLLLHPSPGSADTYATVVEDLAQTFLVVGMDLIGNGFSDKSPVTDPRVEHYAEVAAEALAELRLPPVIAFGSHTGASVALEVACRRPDLVRGLVVEGLAHFTGTEQVDVLTHYTPLFEPLHSGAHVVENWHMLRDMHLFWPWYRSTADAVRDTAPDLASLHNLFVQMLKTGDTYPLAYRAAFRHDPRPAVGNLEVSGWFVAHPADMLRGSTEQLAGLSPHATFVELAPAEGRGPAWAVRAFASADGGRTLEQ